MIRLLIFLLIVLALAFGFSWLADKPGEIDLRWEGNTYQVDLIVFMAGLVALIAAIMFFWAVIRTILRSPAIMSRFFRARRRDRGYQALTTGLIAAGSGDAAAARRYTKDSGKLLGNEPLVKLLDAQTSLLEGKRDEARAVFTDMLKEDQTRLVALRGLYLEAEREGAGEAARQYAEEANSLAPSLPWAGNAKLRFQSQSGDWEAALRTLESNRSAGLIDKGTATRQKAVLLTALAFSEEQASPKDASKHAQQAHKYAPELVPAAVVGARAYARFDKTRAASRLIESVWKKAPHPELAEAYVNLRAGDSVLDRLKRAKYLASLRANHPEGNIAVAEAAIAARDWQAARDAMEPVLRTNLTERACLIMADIEEGEHGDRGRMRDWLSRAVRAPRDAAWTADGYVSDTWMPISPVTGEIDAFEWKVPVEQLQGPQADADTIDIDDLVKPLKPAPSHPSKEEKPAAAVKLGTIAVAAATSSTTPVEAASDVAAIAPGEISDAEIVSEVPKASKSDPRKPREKEPETPKTEVVESETAKSTPDDGSKAEKSQGAVAPVAGTDSNHGSVENQPVEGNGSEPKTVSGNGDVEKPDSGSTGLTQEKDETGVSETPASKSVAGAAEPSSTKSATGSTADDEKDGASSANEAETVDEKSVFPFGRRPDDPGIDPNEPDEDEPKRFRLF